MLFDSNLSFDSHVSSICKTAFVHLKNISKLRPMLSMSNAEMSIHALMTSRLDYCNALLGGCSARINKLQMVQNAAARDLTRTRKYDYISPVLSTLHWLPIKHCIDFKILLITYKALNCLAPQYLSKLLSHYSPPRSLRSQNSGHLSIFRHFIIEFCDGIIQLSSVMNGLNQNSILGYYSLHYSHIMLTYYSSKLVSYSQFIKFHS